MGSGSPNAEQLWTIIEKAQNAHAIIGDAPGAFSISQRVAVSTRALTNAPVHAFRTFAAFPDAQLSVGESLLVQNAVMKTNAAAPTSVVTPAATPPSFVKLAATPTPSDAPPAAPTSGNTPAASDVATTIGTVASELPVVAETPSDIQRIIAGSTATLQWWGWTLKLNEDATTALNSLLTKDIGGLVAIASVGRDLSPTCCYYWYFDGRGSGPGWLDKCRGHGKA